MQDALAPFGMLQMVCFKVTPQVLLFLIAFFAL